MKCELPIRYFENNLVFSETEAWAYYEVNSYYYDFLREEKKLQNILSQSAMFMGIKAEFHLLVIPVEQNIHNISRKYEKQIKGSLAAVGKEHNQQVAEVIAEKYKTSRKPLFFMGVKLIPYQVESFKDRLVDAVSHVKDSIHRVADIYTIKEKDIKRYERVEVQVFERLKRYIGVSRATKKQIQFLIEHSFMRGLKKVVTDNLTIPYEVKEGKRMINVLPLKRLTEGCINNNHLDYLSIAKNGRVSYMAFLCISEFTYEASGIGNEFIYNIQNFPFPVDVSVRVKLMENEKARKNTRNKKTSLEKEANFAEESGKSPSPEVLDGVEGLTSLEYSLKKERIPLLAISTVLCVYAETLGEMRSRVEIIKEGYKSDFDMTLEQPYGDQFLLLNEFIAGGKMYITDYVQLVEPNFLASGAFGATKELGDPYGFFLGTTGINRSPVYINPILAAQGLEGTVTNSLSVGVTGQMGGGKSVLVNDLTYHIALSGGRVLIFDPKGERGKWIDKLPELGEELNIVTLEGIEENRGCLDPWNIADGDEAITTATYVCMMLLSGNGRDSRLKIVTKAIKEVNKLESPCMLKVIDNLLSSREEKIRDVGEDLLAFESVSFAKLLFGDGTCPKTITLESAMNVLQVQDLALPKKEVDPEKYTLENVLSLAILTPTNMFGRKFVRGDRRILKIYLNEEAWANLGSSDGKRLSDEMSREGRALNSGIYYVSQDVGVFDSVVKDNMGMRFAFRCRDNEEVLAVLNFFDMENTLYNRELLKTLGNGQCLFQDIWGRIGVINVDPVFEELFDAWDTRPPIDIETVEVG